MIEGVFRQRYNSDQFDFKLNKLHLLDTVKTMLTKQVVVEIAPQAIDAEFISFIDKNIKANPGKSSIKFNITDNRHNFKVGLYTLEKGFTMNDDMAAFLNENKDVEVSVVVG